MIVYHGSNVVVEEPRIKKSNRNLDFGVGFYTTTNMQQAQSFSRIVCNRRSGMPAISRYNFDVALATKELHIKKFERPDDAWFDFVCENRMGIYKGQKYDIIIGPIANDTVYRTFVAFLAGILDREAALAQLRVRELYNQMTFCTEESLEYISFDSIVEVQEQ